MANKFQCSSHVTCMYPSLPTGVPQYWMLSAVRYQILCFPMKIQGLAEVTPAQVWLVGQLDGCNNL